MIDLDTHMEAALRLFDLGEFPLKFRPQSLNKLPELLTDLGEGDKPLFALCTEAGFWLPYSIGYSLPD